MLIRMILRPVMAPVTRIHLRTTTESEPPVRLGIVRATAAARKIRSRHDSEVLAQLASRRWRTVVGFGGGRGEQELDFGHLEAHPVVALAAYSHGGVAAHGNDSGRGLGGRALGAGWDEVGGEHIDHGTTIQVEIAGAY